MYKREFQSYEQLLGQGAKGRTVQQERSAGAGAGAGRQKFALSSYPVTFHPHRSMNLGRKVARFIPEDGSKVVVKKKHLSLLSLHLMLRKGLGGGCPVEICG